MVKAILWEYEPRSDGKCDIKIYISHLGKKKYYHIGYAANKKDWFKGKVRTNAPSSREINSKIVSACNSFDNLLLNNPGLPIDSIIQLYESGTGQSKATLLWFFEKFIKECEEGILHRSENTVKVYRTTLKHLKAFSATHRHADFPLINKEWYDSFIAFLRKPKEEGDEGIGDNAIGKYIKTLKTVMNEANERGLTNCFEHRKKYFHVPSKEVDSIYLNEKEIKLFIQAKLKNKPHLIRERDRFIVSYYFLLRHSDSVKIDKSMIYKEGKRLFIRIQPQKTIDHVVIPVKPIVLDILEENNYNLGQDTNQEANRKLKEIAKVAEINAEVFLSGISYKKHQLITTHTARRSGATNLFLQGVPEGVIMKLGGWKSREAFRRYIRADQLEFAKIAAGLKFYR